MKPKNYWQKYCSSKCRIIAWAIKEMFTKDYWGALPKKEQEILKQKAKDLVK
jgi:hypothetical protein